MSGLAVGSFYFGRIADRKECPLRLYAILEVGIGVFAFISPILLNVLNAVHSFERAIQLAPLEPLPHSGLADSYLTQKRYDDALKANAEALRLAPNALELQEQRRQIQAAMQQKS